MHTAKSDNNENLLKTKRELSAAIKKPISYQESQQRICEQNSLQQNLESAVNIIKHSKNCVVLTGAGISVDSHVPDYRGNNGIWRKFPPEEYASLQAYTSNPNKVWKSWIELATSFY